MLIEHALDVALPAMTTPGPRSGEPADSRSAEPRPLEPGPPELGAYAATRCPRRTHNDFDKTIPRLIGQVEVSPEVQGRIDAGIEFEATIRALLRDALGGDCIDFSGIDFSVLNVSDANLSASEFQASALIAATDEAMTAGVSAILGGQLPTDLVGGRRGRPDVLLRMNSDPGQPAMYVPVDIKSHKVLTDAKGSSPAAVLSRIGAPSFDDRYPDVDLTGRRQERDALQLAHYWRMLEACGRAPDIAPVAGIIGTDLLDGGPVILWHDLDRAIYKTFSRSNDDAHTLRSAMQRYDHEFTFRSEIATVARSRTGSSSDPLPLVEPVRIRECNDCPWFDVCMAHLGDDDASARIGRLSAREWLALAGLGYQTYEQVASLDLEVIEGRSADDEVGETSSATAALLSEYLPEVAHIQNAQRRLRDAVRAAQMVSDGTHLRRLTDGPVNLPRADIEIDFDIENDRDARVYLWGILVTDHTTGDSHFEHTTSWDELDAVSESVLARTFWDRLREIVDGAHREGKSVLIYHYSTPEPSNLQRISQAGLVRGLPEPDDVDSLIEQTFIDMYPIVRANYFGRDGLGLKVVATRGAGFAWRDEDPGGLQSITWLEQVRSGEADLKQRLLEYNEDDVRATAALRDWMAPRG